MACLQRATCHACGESYLADFRRVDIECPKCLLQKATLEADNALASAQARARVLARGTSLASTVLQNAKLEVVIDWLCRDREGGDIAYQRNLKRFWEAVQRNLAVQG